jgi:hypothetical protein
MLLWIVLEEVLFVFHMCTFNFYMLILFRRGDLSSQFWKVLIWKFIFDLKGEVLHFVLAFQIVIMELFLNAHESYIVMLVLWCL